MGRCRDGPLHYRHLDYPSADGNAWAAQPHLAPMKLIRRIQVLAALLLLGLSSRDARADGGVIRLFEAKGPYVVTIFTASEPVQDSPVDVSVLVQRRDSSEAILDANVDLMFTPPTESTMEPVEQMCGQSGEAPMSPPSDGRITQFTIPATHKQAS